MSTTSIRSSNEASDLAICLPTTDDESGLLPGLTLETAIVYHAVSASFSLNRANLQKEYQRKINEAEDVGSTDAVPKPLDFEWLEKSIQICIRQELPLDVALSIVLSQAGLDYWKTDPEVAVTKRGTLLKFVPESQVTRTPDTHTASHFMAINSPICSEPNAIQPRPARTSGVPAKKFRLQPHEECPAGKEIRLAPERFSWNVGFWLKKVIGDGNSTDYTRWERLAEGLSILRTSSGALSPEERSLFEEKKPSGELRLNHDQYRSLRARLFIGLACIYEHNLRGSILNERRRLHPACRPDLSCNFKYLNMGASQAQMHGYGADVGKISKVFNVCVELGYIPDSQKTSVSSSKSVYAINPLLEEYFPSERRALLYERLEKWYSDEGILRHLRYVIQASDLELP